jgi:hypothetical protein
MAVPVINIGSKLDGKGFKQAETATEKLTKNVKNLASTFGLAFGTAAVLRYARTSIKAAADDQKAQQQLALALKNVGLERDAAITEEYISKLQSEFGILDDLLRPAYQRLAVATKSTAESQRLLNLALDIGASTGKDVNAVTTALSRAYLGNNTALTRLGVGLSKADLQSKSFEEITTQLADTFAGSASAAAKTFSGQLAILSAGAADATEIIGTGLIDSLKMLSGEGSIQALVDDMKDFGTAVSDTTVGFALFIQELKKIPLLGRALGSAFDNLGTGIIFTDMGKAYRERIEYNKNEHRAKQQTIKSDKTITKLSSTKLSNDKKLLANQKQIALEKKKQEALDQAALVLAQGQKVFDEEGIQLAAAAQGRLTEEERTRLALKTDIYNLEAAINEGNITAASQLANSMVANAQKLATLRTDMIGLNDVQNPFTAWLQTLILMALELEKLAKPLKKPFVFLPKGNTAAEIAANVEQYQKLSDADQVEIFGGLLSDAPPRISSPFNEGPDAARFYNDIGMSGSASGGNVINISVAGSVTTERDLVAAITQGLYSQQASGTPVLYSTVY